MEKRDIDVIVIGAGIAGLTCARDLPTSLNVCVLEGSEKIGGRVQSFKASDGTILEMGAQYIHGTKDNPLYDFAIEEGVIKPDNKEWKPFKFLPLFHKEVISKTTKAKQQKAIDIVSEFDFQYFTENLSENEKERHKTVGKHWMSLFDGKLALHSDDPELCEALKSVYLHKVLRECNSNGSKNLDELDIYAYSDYDDLEGDMQYSLGSQNGYMDIVIAIARDLHPECIRFNHVVNRISFCDSIKKFTIFCENGTSFNCKYVVLTVSIEVLKQFLKKNLFAFPLPEKKVKSIQNLYQGSVNKVFFKFSTAISKDTNFMYFYPSTNSLNMESIEGYESVGSIERIDESDWWLMWLNHELLPTLPVGKSVEEQIAFFDSLMEDLMKSYPEAPDLRMEASTIKVSDWTANPLFLGAYSFIKTGVDSFFIDGLAEPLFFLNDTSHGLLFAGEMTSKVYYSTTHGAYSSGAREAKRIGDLSKHS